MKTTMKIMLGLLVIIFASCGSQNQKDQARLERENRSLRGKIKGLESELKDAANSKSPWEIADSAIKDYKDSLKANQNRLKAQGLLGLNIKEIDPELEWGNWKDISYILDYSCKEKTNQIRLMNEVFYNSFLEDVFYDEKKVIWRRIKSGFKSNPKGFERWFNFSKPILKAFREKLGLSFAITKETKEFLNKKFNPALEKEFLKAYLSNPLDHYVYCDTLEERYLRGEFVKFGYSPENIYFRNTQICKDFKDWVWHYEYSPDGVAVVKRMVLEIESWD